MIRHNNDLGDIVPQGPVANTATDIVKNITGGTPVQNKTKQDALNTVTDQVSKNLAAEYAANQLIKSAQDYLKQHPEDIAPDVPTDQWTLAISSNETRVTPWGYQHVKSSAEDGTVVLYNAATNEIKYLDDITEDAQIELTKFKERESEAIHKFKKAEEFEAEVAKAEADMDKPRAAIDIICDFVHAALDYIGTERYTADERPDGLGYDAKHPNLVQDKEAYRRVKESLTAMAETSWVNRTLISNEDLTHQIGKLLYKGEVEKAHTLLQESGRSEREKGMLAYYAAQQQGLDTKRIDWGDAVVSMGLEGLANMGRDMDYVQSVVRGVYLWNQVNKPLDVNGWASKLEQKLGYTDYSEEQYRLLKNAELSDVIASCYRASWENEGRQAYDFDTGIIPFDFALEICTDPDTLLALFSSALSSSATKTVVGQLRDAGMLPAGQAGTDLAKRLKMAITTGELSDDLSDIVAEFAKYFPGSEDGIAHILQHSIDYSAAYKLARSTNVLKDAKNYTDDLMAWLNGSHLYGVVLRGVATGVNKLTAEKDIITVKALTDAIAETEGKYGKIDMANLGEVLDYATLNVTTLYKMIVDKGTDVIKYLPDETKLSLISSVYRRDAAYLSAYLAKNPANSEIAQDMAFEFAELQGMTFHLLEREHLTDNNLYKLLSMPEAADICIPPKALLTEIDEFEAHTAAGIANMADTRIPEELTLDEAILESIPTEGKVYQVKINSTIEAEHYVRNANFLGFNEMLVNNPVALYALANKDEATARMINLASAAGAYSTFKNTLKQSGVFNSDQLTTTLDYLYMPSFQKECSRVFTVTGNYTAYQIAGRANRLAHDLLEGAHGLDVQLTEYNAVKMLDYNCNMLDDLDGSVNNMAKLYKAQDGIRPMFYTVKFDDATDGIELVLRDYEGNIKHFTDSSELDDYLIKSSYDATADNTTLKLVGFNNHGSGFGFDAQVRDWLTFNHSTSVYRFTQTTDIADEIRISKGLALPTEAQYEAARGAIIDAYHKWSEHAALAVGGQNYVQMPFRLHAPLTSDISDVLNVATNPNSRLDKDLVKGLQKSRQDWYNIYSSFNSGVSKYVSSYEVQSILQEDLAHIAQLKKVWDAEIINEAYNTDLLKAYAQQKHLGGMDLLSMNTTATEVINIKRDLRIDAVRKIKPETLTAAYKSMIAESLVGTPVAYLDELMDDPRTQMAWLLVGYSHPDWFKPIENKLNGASKRAATRLMLSDWRFMPLYKSDTIGPFISTNANPVVQARLGKGEVLTKIQREHKWHNMGDFSKNQFRWLRKGNNTLTDIDPTLPGRFGAEHTNWDTTQELVDTIDELRSSEQGIMAVREYLRSSGRVRPLAEFELSMEAEQHKAYEIIEDMYHDYIQQWGIEDTGKVVDSFGDEAVTNMDYIFAPQLRGSVLTDFNRGLMLWSQQNLANRFGLVTDLTDDEMASLLLTRCSGRAYFDLTSTNEMSSELLRSRLARITHPNIKVDIQDKFARIWWTGDVPEDLTPYEFTKGISTKIDDEHFIRMMENTRSRNPEAVRDALRKQESLIEELAKYNDGSFTIGNHIANSRALYNQINEKYFGDVFDQLPEYKRFPGYECSYFGQISGLRLDGQFISSNVLVNMANAYTVTCRNNRTIHDYLIAMFDDNVDGHTMLRNMTEHGQITINQLRENRYHWLQWTEDGVRELDLRMFKPEEMMERTCLITHADYNRFKELTKSYATVDKLEIDKKLAAKETLTALQSSLISTYLYTNPLTGVHNIIDSSLKGIMSEGWDHVGYMKEANFLNHGIDECRKAILDSVKDRTGRYPEFISQSDIDKFFAKGDFTFNGGVISRRRFMQVMEYHKSKYASGELDSVPELLGESVKMERFKTGVAQSIADETELFQTKFFLSKWTKGFFEWAENTNRLAIWLHRMDMGDDIETAASRIALSQFDYTKTKAMQGLNGVVPFIQFRLNNLCYWFDKGITNKSFAADLTKLYSYQKDFYHQTAEEQEYRAWLYTLDFSQFADVEVEALEDYNPITDYNGATVATAKDQGWIDLGGKLYFKLGFSIVDAYTGVDLIRHPLSNVFAPLEAALRTAVHILPKGAENATLKALDDLGMDGADLINITKELITSDDAKAVWDQNYFEIASCIPIVGTLLARLQQSERNSLYSISHDTGWRGLLAVLMPDAFAIKKDPSQPKLTYLDRPVGFDWYNKDEFYKSTHRYIAGVSYIPKWVVKDPAQYINTYGRLQQLGMTAEQVQKLMNDGGAFWWTQNNEGVYKLHNYKLMIQDEETQAKIYRDLISFGWTADQAKRLIDEASEPTWTVKPKRQKGGLKSPYTSLQGYRRYANTPIRYQMMPNQLGDRMRTGKNVLIGSYEVAKPRVQHNRTAKSYVHWHRRERDIYKENYAKYGASRMAMTQNLRSYSNKSIVQLHREEQQQRYARIHRHQHW